MIALGDNPFNPASTPFGGKTAGVVQTININSMSIKLNFVQNNKDSITLGGTLSVPPGFTAAGQNVTMVVGGYVSTFGLGQKGTGTGTVTAGAAPGTVGASALKLTVSKKKDSVLGRVASFSTKWTGGDFKPLLALRGLLADKNYKKTSVTVRVFILMNTTLYDCSKLLGWTAKANRSGVAVPGKL